MKNLLLVVLFCLFSIRSYPQTFKGDIGIGGYISANFNKSEFGKNFHAGVAPDVGYFYLIISLLVHSCVTLIPEATMITSLQDVFITFTWVPWLGTMCPLSQDGLGSCTPVITGLGVLM